MPNSYYNSTFDVLPSSRIGSQAIEDQFQLIENGVTAMEAALATKASVSGGPVQSIDGETGIVTGFARSGANTDITSLNAVNGATLGSSDVSAINLIGTTTISNTGVLNIGTFGSWIYRATAFDGSLVIKSGTANLYLVSSGGNTVVISGSGSVAFPSSITADAGSFTALKASGNIDVATQRILASANSGLQITSTDGATFKGIAYNTNNNRLSIGTLTAHPLVLMTSNADRVTIDAAGAITSSGTLALTGTASTLGYGTGAGGSATQPTNRNTTTAAINKSTGNITLASAAGSTSPFSFTVPNSLVSADDCISVCQKSGTDKYMLSVTNVSTGSFVITGYTTGGTTTEQPVIKFTVHKGAAS